MFFPLANTEKIERNTTQANIHPEHKYAIRGSYVADMYTTFLQNLLL